MRAGFRALRIARVVLRHRLDDLLMNTGAGPWLKVLRPFTPPRS
jgi:ubiquinone biosynthesis protein